MIRIELRRVNRYDIFLFERFIKNNSNAVRKIEKKRITLNRIRECL